MLNRYWIALILLVFASLAVVLYTSDDGDSDGDKRFRGCLRECKRIGCVEGRCFLNCRINRFWENLVCQDQCRSYCKEKVLPSDEKYYGKWPFRREVYEGKQAFASVVFSALIFAIHVRGLSRLWGFLYHKMPADLVFYDFAALWHTYGLLSFNSCFWTALFHIRDVDMTEKLHYISAMAVLAFSPVVAMIRSLEVEELPERFVVASLPIAFMTTHIMFINAYELDYGWTMQVCLVYGVVNLTIWGVWAGVTHQYLRWKIWLVVGGCGVTMLLEIYDFIGHFLGYASTIPLSYIWWKVIQDDAESLTILNLIRIVDFNKFCSNNNGSEVDAYTSMAGKKKGKHRKKRK